MLCQHSMSSFTKASQLKVKSELSVITNNGFHSSTDLLMMVWILFICHFQ